MIIYLHSSYIFQNLVLSLEISTSMISNFFEVLLFIGAEFCVQYALVNKKHTTLRLVFFQRH